jgi:hypothetical protein
MRYQLINGKPVPARLAAELRALGLGRDITLYSCLRTQDAVEWARGQGVSLSSQQELYDGFVAGLPGFNPANRPGESTHELRNDGVAYPGPVRMWLPYYKVGIDSSNAKLLCQRAKARGWTATLTYPANPRESHHVNFRKEPKLIAFRALRKGARGPRVGKMTLQLAYLRYLPRAQGRFDEKVKAALREFQNDWPQLVPDGVYGVHTARQLGAAWRGMRRCRREAKTHRSKAVRDVAFKRCASRWGRPRRPS